MQLYLWGEYRWGNILKRYVFIAASSLLAGCATPASKITSSYVSPVIYKNLTCDQLALEAQSVSGRAQTAISAQNQKVTGDAVAFTVGMVVFWPALFFMQGDGAQAAEVARLKGEIEAIERASVQNSCGIQFYKEPPPKPATSNQSIANGTR